MEKPQEQYHPEPLNCALDQVFNLVYAKVASDHVIQWHEFNAAVYDFLDKHPDDATLHDKYFSNVSIISQIRHRNKQYTDAESTWERAIDPVLEWEGRNPTHHVHKGTGYYFWAVYSLWNKRLDRGFLLAHRALEEDSILTGIDYPDSAAKALVTLDSSQHAQFFRPWVTKVSQVVADRIHDYNSARGRSFSIDQFRSNFLNKPPSKEVVFLFAYSIARLDELLNSPEHIRGTNHFSSQYMLSLLRDLVLVTDVSIRHKTGGEYFSNHVHEMSQLPGQDPLSYNDIGKNGINGDQQDDFETTLRNILDGLYAVPSGASPLSGLNVDLAVSYALRNSSAHNVIGPNVVRERFDELTNSVLWVLFRAVEEFYH